MNFKENIQLSGEYQMFCLEVDFTMEWIHLQHNAKVRIITKYETSMLTEEYMN